MGRHFLKSRSLPVASPGNSQPVSVPNPLSFRPCQKVSGGKPSAILAVPTLLDFWITCATVSDRSGCVSWIVRPLTVYTPPAVLMIVLGLILPASSAVATVNGFMVEPGSNRSVTAWLRSTDSRSACRDCWSCRKASSPEPIPLRSWHPARRWNRLWLFVARLPA